MLEKVKSKLSQPAGLDSAMQGYFVELLAWLQHEENSTPQRALRHKGLRAK